MTGRLDMVKQAMHKVDPLLANDRLHPLACAALMAIEEAVEIEWEARSKPVVRNEWTAERLARKIRSTPPPGQIVDL